MEVKKITTLISNTQNILMQDVNYLDSILIKYPYFQSGHLLLTKGLLNTNSIRYNRQLRRAAAYSLNRRKLFQLITRNENIEKTNIKSAKEELNLRSPLKFEEGDIYSFSEWLKLLELKKIKRTKKTEENLVTNFLERKKIIIKPKKETFFNAIDVSKDSLIEDTDLVTPTLAKVYLNQGHYEKAILAYKKLILKYPKKSSFFASQIKLINKLNNK